MSFSSPVASSPLLSKLTHTTSVTGAELYICPSCHEKTGLRSVSEYRPSLHFTLNLFSMRDLQRSFCPYDLCDHAIPRCCRVRPDNTMYLSVMSHRRRRRPQPPSSYLAVRRVEVEAVLSLSLATALRHRCVSAARCAPARGPKMHRRTHVYEKSIRALVAHVVDPPSCTDDRGDHWCQRSSDGSASDCGYCGCGGMRQVRRREWWW